MIFPRCLVYNKNWLWSLLIPLLYLIMFFLTIRSLLFYFFSTITPYPKTYLDKRTIKQTKIARIIPGRQCQPTIDEQTGASSQQRLLLCGSRGVGAVAWMNDDGVTTLDLLDLEEDEEDEDGEEENDDGEE